MKLLNFLTTLGTLFLQVQSLIPEDWNQSSLGQGTIQKRMFPLERILNKGKSVNLVRYTSIFYSIWK